MPPGRDGLKALLSGFRAAFPDYRDLLEELVAEGDRVAARWTFRGTHQGAFQTTPATGKYVSMRGMSIFRLEDGRIVDDWTELDMLGFMRQITAT